jgi:2Fe-2S ferredoxin
MPKITYITADGAPVETDATTQMTLMEVALIHNVPGIIGMCGGICSCGTCHLQVAQDWISRLAPPSDEEKEMVESLDHSSPASRLGCQVTVTEDMDGLVVHVVEGQ